MSTRFTDAELMAEYWRAMASSQVSINLANRSGTHADDRERLMRDSREEASKAGAFLQFATLPHAQAVKWCTCDHPADDHNSWWSQEPACICCIENPRG